MSCNTYNDIIDCSLSTGGLSKVYLFPYGSLYDFTYDSDNLNYISDYQLSTLGVEIKVTKDSTVTDILEKGNTDSYRYELALSIQKLEWEKRNEIAKLIRGALTLIVKDRNGKCWILGKDAPARVITYQAATGAIGSDSLYTLTIAAFSKEPVKEIRCYDGNCAISVNGGEYRQSLFTFTDASSLSFSGVYELLGDDITRAGTPITPLDPLNWSNPAIYAADLAFVTSLVNPNGNTIVEMFYNIGTDEALIVIYSSDTSYPFLTIAGSPYSAPVSISVNLVTTLSTSLTGVVITVQDQAMTILYSGAPGDLVSGLGISGRTNDSFIDVSLLYPLGQTFTVSVEFDGESCTFTDYTYTYEPSNECQMISNYSVHNGKHYTCTVDKLTATPTYRDLTIVIGEYQFNLYNSYFDYHSSFATLESNIQLSLNLYPDLNITNIVVTEGVKDWTLEFDSLDDDNIDFYIYTRGDDSTTLGDAETGDIRKFKSTRSTVLALQTAAPSDSQLSIVNANIGAEIYGDYGFYPNATFNVRLEELPPFTNNVTNSIGIDINDWFENDIITIANDSLSCPDVINEITIDTCLDSVVKTNLNHYYRYELQALDLGSSFTIDATSSITTFVLPSNVTPANFPDFGETMRLTYPEFFNANLQFDAITETFYLEIILAKTITINTITADDITTDFTQIAHYDEHNIQILPKQHPDIQMDYTFDTYNNTGLNNSGKIKEAILSDYAPYTKYFDFYYDSVLDTFEVNYLFNSAAQGYTIEFFYVFPSAVPGVHSLTVPPTTFNTTFSSISASVTLALVKYLRIRNGLGYEQIIAWDGVANANTLIDVRSRILFKEVYGRFDDVKLLYTFGGALPNPTVTRLSINCPNTDIDVMNFLIATGITDPIIEDALNDFVTNLKFFGLWNKFDAIYPFVGGTAFTHKFNLKNPMDSDSAFRLSFAGGWTHSANGALNNGAAYANTFYNELANASLNDKHIAIYNRRSFSSALYDDMGVTVNASIASPTTDIIPFYSVNNCYMRNSANTGAFGNTNSQGYFCNNRQSSVLTKGQRNATLNSIAVVSASLINGNYYIGALNDLTTGNATAISNNQYAYASIGRSFNDTQAANAYAAVQAFQIALSRQV